MLRLLKRLAFRALSFRVRNNHMTMLSGAKMYIFRPERSDPIRMIDLAQSMSLLCRWSGNLPGFYCVGQHSVYALRRARIKNAPWIVQFIALFHEVGEPVMGDQPSPVKRGMFFFRWTEDQFQEWALIRIANDFYGVSITPEMIAEAYPAVKEIDIELLRAERVTLRNGTTGICSDRGKPIHAHPDDEGIHDLVDPDFTWWSFEEAKQAFLEATIDLTPARKD